MENEHYYQTYGMAAGISGTSNQVSRYLVPHRYDAFNWPWLWLFHYAFWRAPRLPSCSHGWTMVCGRPIFTCAGLGSWFSPANSQNLNHGCLDTSGTITYKILSPRVSQTRGHKTRKLLKIDAISSAPIQGRYAKVCVQINMANLLPKRVKIGSFWEDIIYENLPILCYRCGRLGHREPQCSEGMTEQITTSPQETEPRVTATPPLEPTHVSTP